MKIQYEDVHVKVFESALYRTTSSVICLPELVLVVDPNFFPGEIERIRSYVQSILEDKQLYLFFTHSDFDHIIGAGAFPEAKIIASSEFEQNSEKQKQVEQIRKMDDEFYIKRSYPIVYPSVDILIKENVQILSIGSSTLHFFKAPGHTRDGLFLVVENPSMFVCGDYLSNIEFPFIEHSLVAYWKTMQRVKEILCSFSIEFLIPGHGDVCRSEIEMKRRVFQSTDYLKKLRDHVVGNGVFEEESLWEIYDFPRSLRKYHRENIHLAKAELNNLSEQLIF